MDKYGTHINGGELQWLPDTPLAPRPVVSRIAVPMVRLLAEKMNFPDKALGEDIIGFSLLDHSQPVKYSCQDRLPKPRLTALQVSEL